MSDTMTQTSATQTPSSSTDFAPCSRKCRWNIRVGSGFVPSTRRLFFIVRKTDITRALPLTRAEVLSQEMCQACAKRAGFETVPTVDMLKLQEFWAAENIDRKESALDNQASFLERQRIRNLEYAIKNEHRSPINRLLATIRVEDNKPRPKHRTHHHVAVAPNNGPKKFGDEHKPATDEPKRRKKGADNDGQKKQKRGAR